MSVWWALTDNFIRSSPILTIDSFRRLRQDDLVDTPNGRPRFVIVTPRLVKLFFDYWKTHQQDDYLTLKNKPFLNVSCPLGTSRSIGPLASAANAQDLQQKCVFGAGERRHHKHRDLSSLEKSSYVFPRKGSGLTPSSRISRRMSCYSMGGWSLTVRDISASPCSSKHNQVTILSKENVVTDFA